MAGEKVLGWRRGLLAMAAAAALVVAVRLPKRPEVVVRTLPPRPPFGGISLAILESDSNGGQVVRQVDVGGGERDLCLLPLPRFHDPPWFREAATSDDGTAAFVTVGTTAGTEVVCEVVPGHSRTGWVERERTTGPVRDGLRGYDREGRLVTTRFEDCPSFLRRMFFLKQDGCDSLGFNAIDQALTDHGWETVRRTDGNRERSIGSPLQPGPPSAADRERLDALASSEPGEEWLAFSTSAGGFWLRGRKYRRWFDYSGPLVIETQQPIHLPGDPTLINATVLGSALLLNGRTGPVLLYDLRRGDLLYRNDQATDAAFWRMP